LEQLQWESHPRGLSLGINGWLTSGLRGTAALPWVPLGLMAGSQGTKKKKVLKLIQEGRCTFFCCQHGGLWEKETGSFYPDTYSCDFSWLAEPQKKKVGTGKYNFF